MSQKMLVIPLAKITFCIIVDEQQDLFFFGFLLTLTFGNRDGKQSFDISNDSRAASMILENKPRRNAHFSLTHVTPMSQKPIDWPQIIATWDSTLATSRKTIIRALRLGVPDRHRSQVWSLLTYADNARASAAFTYEDLVARDAGPDSESFRVIDLDVPRTTPAWCRTISAESKEALRRVLRAYANADPELGYTQGMNFIARMFLLRQPEELAFWSFYSLMHLSSLPHRLFFIPTLPKANYMSQLLEHICTTRFPSVVAAFRARDHSFLLFAPQWFMVAFLSMSFDFDLASFIFDEYLAYGIAPLVSFALTIIDLHQHLLAESFDALLQALSNPGKSQLMRDRHRVNIAWNRHWVTTGELNRLKKEANIEI
jgi:hypothetical protein